MSKEKESFLKLTTREKIENLSQTVPEIMNLVKKDTKDLTETEADSLYQLKAIDQEASDVSEQFLVNLDTIKKDGFNDFAEKLSGESKETQDLAKEIFNNTITSSINKASEDLNKETKKSKSLFSSGTLVSAAATVLGGILEFEKKIDKVFPGASEKIIQLAGNAIVSLISASFPVVGLVLRATGVVDKISKFFACENLEKTVTSLNDKVQEIEQNKKLEKFYATAEQVGTLSQVAEIPIRSAINLGLSATDCKSVSDAVKQNPQEKKFIQDIAQIATKMPNNAKETQAIIGTLKTELYATVDKHNLPADLLKSAHLKIDSKMLDIEKSLNKTTSSSISILEKITHQQDASVKILSIQKELQSEFNKMPGGREIAETIAKDMMKLVKDILQFSPAKLLQQVKESSVAKTLGLDFKTEVALSKQVPQQNLERS